jgi:hypothetical protein
VRSAGSVFLSSDYLLGILSLQSQLLYYCGFLFSGFLMLWHL